MSPSAAQPPFDQGLFLTHFNKGREAYDGKRFEEALHELEEAYLLRPRDTKVLNLLGLVYFKQDRYDKAEEVYRKLLADSPDAHTLHYNLGLIYFKLNRLDEAESAFLKAQELSTENPKISFYLGSIYERQRRFQDAIYHYRRAGASLMVRRVEDKLAGSRAAPSAAPKAASAVAPPNPRTDTARFRAEEVREAIRRAEDALVGPRLKPVGEPVLARDALPHRPGQVGDVTLPGPRNPDGSGRGRLSATQPVRLEQERFRLLENALLEVTLETKVFIKPGTVYSYQGALTFWVKERRAGGHPSLAIVTGKGRLLLKDKGREVTFLQVETTQHVEPSHLLACDDTLTPRYVRVGTDKGAAEFLALDGHGLLALSVASRPLTLVVTPDLPVSVPATSLITWSGALTPTLVTNPEMYESALPADGGTWIRLEGDGRVLVEQKVE
jgi:uncharacterized protein (AIM24 family)